MREQATSYLHKYVNDDYQRHHGEMVGTAMEAVADHLNVDDKEIYYITGLIHDWDYDQWPEEHPHRYEQLQDELGVNDEVITAIKGHISIDSPRPTLLSKTLFACDEFSGLLYAYMKMVGSYGAMKPKSIRKKVHKDKSFAAKIDRTHVITAITELGEETGIDEESFYILLRDAFAAKYDS